MLQSITETIENLKAGCVSGWLRLGRLEAEVERVPPTRKVLKNDFRARIMG